MGLSLDAGKHPFYLFSLIQQTFPLWPNTSQPMQHRTHGAQMHSKNALLRHLPSDTTFPFEHASLHDVMASVTKAMDGGLLVLVTYRPLQSH